MRGALGWISMALVSFSFSSCIGPPYADVTDCADYVETPSEYHMEAAGRAGMLTQQEHTFVCYATVLGRAQLASARLAARQGTNAAVKRLAAATISEEEMRERRLTDIAEQYAGIIPPYALDAVHLAMLNELSKLSGAAFDRAYLQSQLQDGQATIAVFQQEAAEGGEPIMRRFAINTLPLVEERVREAESVIDQLGS